MAFTFYRNSQQNDEQTQNEQSQLRDDNSTVRQSAEQAERQDQKKGSKCSGSGGSPETFSSSASPEQIRMIQQPSELLTPSQQSTPKLQHEKTQNSIASWKVSVKQLAKEQMYGLKLHWTRFEPGQKSTRSRFKKHLFCFTLFSSFFYLTCQFPWVLFARDYINHSAEESVAQDQQAHPQGQATESHCHEMLSLRGIAGLLHQLNLLSWLFWKTFSKKYHLIRYALSLIFMVLTIPLQQCPAITQQSPLSLIVYNLCVACQITSFSWLFALTELHLMATTWFNVILQVSLLGKWVAIDAYFYNYWMVVNGVLMLGSASSLLGVCFMNLQIGLAASSLEPSSRQKDIESQAISGSKTVTFADIDASIEGQIHQDASLSVISEQLSCGMAITADWYDPSHRNPDQNEEEPQIHEEESQGNIMSFPMSSRSHYRRSSSLHSFQSGNQNKIQQEEINLANSNIYQIMGQSKQATGKSFSSSASRNFDKEIFSRKCLFPSETDSNVSQSGSGLLKRHAKPTSLHSLAQKHGSIQGYYTLIPSLSHQGQNTSAEGLVQKVVKVEIKRIQINKEPKQLFFVSDISEFISNQTKKLKHNFSRQLTASMCHEVMNPLNCIINVSDHMLQVWLKQLESSSRNKNPNRREQKKSQAPPSILDDVQNHVDLARSLQSSAQFMRLLLCSQMSSVKHSLHQLMLKFDPIEKCIEELLAQFLEPYRFQMDQKALKLVLKITNEIPRHLCLDWQVYEQILFHLMQNAVKFSKFNSTITIVVTFCTFYFVKKNDDGETNRQDRQLLPRMEYDTTQELKSQGFLLTHLVDEGCGVKESDYQSLFSMFNKSESNFYKNSGVGLGLTTAKVLTQALQGGIHLQSSEGIGTEVGFSVLAETQSTYCKSKDIKQKIRELKEEYTFKGFDKSRLRLSSPELSCNVIKITNKLSTLGKVSELLRRNCRNERVSPNKVFDCFYAGALMEELSILHSSWMSLLSDQSKERTLNLLQSDANKQKLSIGTLAKASSIRAKFRMNSVINQPLEVQEQKSEGSIESENKIKSERQIFDEGSYENRKISSKPKDSELNLDNDMDHRKYSRKIGLNLKAGKANDESVRVGIDHPMHSVAGQQKQAANFTDRELGPGFSDDIRDRIDQIGQTIAVNRAKHQQAIVKGFREAVVEESEEIEDEEQKVNSSQQSSPRYALLSENASAEGQASDQRLIAQPIDLDRGGSCGNNGNLLGAQRQNPFNSSSQVGQARGMFDLQSSRDKHTIKSYQSMDFQVNVRPNGKEAEGCSQLLINEESKSSSKSNDSSSMNQAKSLNNPNQASSRPSFNQPSIREPSCCTKAEVLLVDDQIFNLLPLKGILQTNFDQRCDEAINGLIAVDMYLRNMSKTCCDVRYRVIFTDINMPEMDGITEAKTIMNHEKILLEKNPSLPKVLIIMVSAFDDDQILAKVKALGIKHYLNKPVNSDSIRPILQQIFGPTKA